MKARTVVVVLALLFGLAGVGAAIGAVVAGGDGEEAKPSASGAQQVVDAIGAKWPVPNPRDTSDGCRAKAGDSGPGCESRVTTDAVTVTELADEAGAARWAQQMAKVSDARQAGRYVLSWADDQDVTSAEARASMVSIAKGL